MNRLVLICVLLHYTSALKFPETIERCVVSEKLDNKPNECIARSMQNVMRGLKRTPLPELGLPIIDPLLVDKIVINREELRGSSIKMQFNKAKLSGLGDAKITEVSGNLSKPENFRMIMNYQIDKAVIEGDFKMQARFLILPFEGEGPSNVTLDNFSYVSKLYGKPFLKNGRKHLKAVKLTMKFIKAERLSMNLDNIFKRNKALGQNISKYVNENWEVIIDDFIPSFNKIFETIVLKYMNDVFERVPFDELFIVQ